MAKFEIGDRVKCIKVGKISSFSTSRRYPPLKLGAEYIVQDIRTCGCGHVTIDVGLFHTGTEVIVCARCEHAIVSDVWWCASIRFVKQEEKTATRYIAVPCEVKIEEFNPN